MPPILHSTCSALLDGAHWQMARARRHPIPTRAEQILLGRSIRAWQDHPGGPDAAPPLVRRRGRRALDRLVSGNLRLVFRFASHHCAPGLEMDDLIQAGSEGLMEAALRFDPARGYAFSTYAAWWLRQSLQRERRRALPIAVPHEVAALADRATAVSQRLQQDGEAPTLERLAEELSTGRAITPERVARCLRVSRECRPYSLDAPLQGSEVLSLSDACAADAPEPLDVAIESERLERVRLAVDRLGEEARGAVVSIDFGGLSYAGAAALHGVTREGLRRRHIRARQQLKRHLHDLRVAA